MKKQKTKTVGLESENAQIPVFESELIVVETLSEFNKSVTFRINNGWAQTGPPNMHLDKFGNFVYSQQFARQMPMSTKGDA